jgi:hypothetical protein
MSKFPKSWDIVPVGPDEYCVLDADGRKLFYISADDNPDGEGKPGDDDGPTILDYGDDSDELKSKIEEMFTETEAELKADIEDFLNDPTRNTRHPENKK